MKTRKYTEQEFIKAVKNSYSIRQVLIKLNVQPYGGNYQVAKKNIKELKLDTSHFKGQGWNLGKHYPPRPIEIYLSNEKPISSHKLRLRLLKEEYFDHKCYQCNLTHWNEQPIPLELEHKDGNNKNNKIENLTLLCPNCHAQTPTYRRAKSSQ